MKNRLTLSLKYQKMNDSKKIEFSIGTLTMLNSMKENVQDSILASLARVASNQLNTLIIKPLNKKENSYFIRPNQDYTIVFEIQNDTILVTSILSAYLIKSYQASTELHHHYEKI